MNRVVIALNKLRMRLRHTRVAPDELLLLFSSCLQRSDCERNVSGSLDNCARCGRCVVAQLLAAADQYGVEPFIATGGRLAAGKARDPKIKAVVAVACCKELGEGIKAIFPKPVLVCELTTPNGPCKDTQVDVSEVRRAIEFFLQPDSGTE